MASTDEVAAVAREVLESSNLDEISEKKLRQMVRERTGADTSLPDLKALIHTVVQEFVEQDSRDGDAEEVPEVKAKEERKGPVAKRKKQEEVEEEDEREEEEEEEEEQRPSKAKGKKQPPTAKKFEVGDSGELLVCKLSNKRKVTVGTYRNTLFVNIREFYEKDGEERPGKGISLPVDQWETLSKHMKDVDAAIQQASR